MLRICSNFPGGNIICERIDDASNTATMWLRQDWSSSTEWWFYWQFRVQGAAGKTVRFCFSDGDVFAARGPCFSEDGQTWQWLGRKNLHLDADAHCFEYSFPQSCDGAFFSFCIPYMGSHLAAFLQKHPHVQRMVLTRSEKGRQVELLTLRSQRGTYVLPIVARSHACEAMANYAIEGIVEYWLNSREPAAGFLREHVDLQIVPFLDKDGVEDGEQGKLRAPHDHNRDYTDKPLYASTRALMQLIQHMHAEARNVIISMDIHCPWIRHGINEELATVGIPQPWQEELERFMALLEQSQTGVLKFSALNCTPHGHEWNQGTSHTFNRFMRDNFPQSQSWAFEIPYAQAGGQEMPEVGARAFGSDVARATSLYIEQRES
jgi:hypothetical protein